MTGSTLRTWLALVAMALSHPASAGSLKSKPLQVILSSNSTGIVAVEPVSIKIHISYNSLRGDNVAQAKEILQRDLPDVVLRISKIVGSGTTLLWNQGIIFGGNIEHFGVSPDSPATGTASTTFDAEPALAANVQAQVESLNASLRNASQIGVTLHPSRLTNPAAIKALEDEIEQSSREKLLDYAQRFKIDLQGDMTKSDSGSYTQSNEGWTYQGTVTVFWKGVDTKKRPPKSCKTCAVGINVDRS